MRNCPDTSQQSTCDARPSDMAVELQTTTKQATNNNNNNNGK